MFFDQLFKRKLHPATYTENLMASLLVMAWMVEARDPYTGGHLWRVSRFARMLAQSMELGEESIARISIGGFLHDLGKISIPDAILNKRDRLTDEEYDIIKTHPEVGLRTLSGHPLSDLVKNSILCHHETPDGKGYPHQLAGDMVPLEARIVGICDAFDAMTSTRPYRKGMPIDQALRIIEENLGCQFDRVIGLQFIELGRSGALQHIVGHTDIGIPLHECPMCGPTLVLRRGQKSGSHVYCRSCKGEFVVENGPAGLVTKATGNKGSAQDVEAEADSELIERLVRESARAIVFSEIIS